jgi:hypothetical protein
MAATLRQLLVQRAARLQERPALTAPGWGTLGWGAYRNRVEGVAMGLLAAPRPLGAPVFLPGGGPWAWAAEVAAACAGLGWDPTGATVDAAILGGAAFNSEDGRGPYHDRDAEIGGDLPFCAGLDQASLLVRLGRLNHALGWDHKTMVRLPLAQASSPAGRAALWSALYAGAHADLTDTEAPAGGWFRRAAPAPPFDPAPFEGFWT